jgi:hypothetical protein
MDNQNPSGALDLKDIRFQIKVKNHFEHPRVIKTISVRAEHPQLGDIVSLNAWRISRANCAGSFLSIMDEENEMHQFSVTLFDKYGKIRPHLVDPGYRSGTGCWGREINSGELVYILDMKVNEQVSGICVLRRFNCSPRLSVSGEGSWNLDTVAISRIGTCSKR